MPRLPLSLLVVGLLTTLGLTACSDGTGTPPDVATGTFTATLSGAVVDTLRGEAWMRMDGDRVTGLELSVDSLRGFSIDLEPTPPRRRVYEAIDAELFGTERDALPGMVVFLELNRGQFQSVAGSLRVTYTEPSEIGATFNVALEGSLNRLTDDLAIRAQGALRAQKTTSN